MRIILGDKKGKSKMNDRVMNTYIYTTRDIADALKRNGITKNSIQISQYIRDNNFDERGMAIKNREQIPGLNEECLVWRISMYGANEILKYFLDKRRIQEEISKKYIYEIKQLVKKYKKEYLRCNGPAIVTFMNENKYAERNLAIQTRAGRGGKWLISQEGVDEMLKFLFKKKQLPIENVDVLGNENNYYIYGTKNIFEEIRKTHTFDTGEITRLLEELGEKVPTSQGVYNPQKPGMFMWRISNENLEKAKNKLTPKTRKQKNKYEESQMTIKEIQEKQKPITNKENVYEIVLDDEYSGYLSIISKSLNKNEVDVIRNLVEKFIDDKKEKIANIINF